MTMDPAAPVPWMRYNDLDDIPTLRKSSGKSTIPSKLLLSKEAIPALELHLSTVGLDIRRISHTRQEQHKVRVAYMHLLKP